MERERRSRERGNLGGQRRRASRITGWSFPERGGIVGRRMMIAALYSYIIFIREKMTNSAFVDVETMGADMAGTAAGGYNCFLPLRLRLRYDGWKIMMSIVASRDNSNPHQSRRDDESGHRRSRHNRFARMVLQLHNQTARPQLPHMLPWPHQSCRRCHLHLQLRQTMILPMLPWSQSQSRSCSLRQHLYLFVVSCVTIVIPAFVFQQFQLSLSLCSVHGIAVVVAVLDL